MSSLFEMLTQQLSGDSMRTISSQIGADEGTTRNALTAVLPLLMTALSRNASGGRGAEDLSRALSRDHDGSILDNLPGFLQNPDTNAGDGILRHVLGDRKVMVQRGLSKSSGLDAGSVGKLMSMLAPVLMGALGKVKSEKGLDPGGLAGYLGQETASIERNAPQAMGMFGKLLDADGDGDVDMSDIARHGIDLLGKFFRK